MTPDLVKCSACGIVGYPRKNGTPRGHAAPGDGPATDRPLCPGSGQPGTPVERTR